MTLRIVVWVVWIVWHFGHFFIRYSTSSDENVWMVRSLALRHLVHLIGATTFRRAMPWAMVKSKPKRLNACPRQAVGTARNRVLVYAEAADIAARGERACLDHIDRWRALAHPTEGDPAP